MVKNKQKKRPAFYMLVYTLVIFAFLLVCLSGLCVYDFYIASADQSNPSIYIFRGDKRVKTLNETNLIFENGEPLVDIALLSDYCKYGIAGDADTRTISFSDGTFASFSEATSFSLNGEKNFLSQECRFSESRFFVPLSFFYNYVDGLRFSTNEAKTKIYIDISLDKFSLVSYNANPETALSANDYFSAVASRNMTPEFKSDLSSYEEYMNPRDRDKYLFLINYENKLDKDYIPSQLTDLIHTRKDGRNTQQLDLYAAKAMEAMLKEAAANGYTSLSITSGYRSYKYQQVLFNNQVNALRASYGDKAEIKATEAVALPGTSEHQSGLCADLHNLPSASQRFAQTEEYKWLVENCAKFGFILRYPKNKTEITKIMFEPWHYRYVGRYHAQRIMQEGMCLEEYVAFINSHE